MLATKVLTLDGAADRPAGRNTAGGWQLGDAGAIQDSLARLAQTFPSPCQCNRVSLSGTSLGEEVAKFEECWVGNLETRAES